MLALKPAKETNYPRNMELILVKLEPHILIGLNFEVKSLHLISMLYTGTLQWIRWDARIGWYALAGTEIYFHLFQMFK